MHAFVTGGSGYLGRHLLDTLASQGIPVRALARSEKAARTVQEHGAEPVRGELDSPTALREGMTGCDVVFHCAAWTLEPGTDADFHRVNVTGTEAVLSAARESGVRRFVHVSTESVLADGSPLVQVDESRPLPARPFPGYAAAKALGERRVLEANGGALSTVVVRPCFLWGNDDPNFVPRISAELQSGRFRWVDGGRFLTTTCHILNACEGLLRAAERGRGGEVYFVTDGQPVELFSFLSALLESQGLKAPAGSIPFWAARALAHSVEGLWRALIPNARPLPLRLGLYILGQEVTLRDDKARRELGYVGLVGREEGLEALRQKRLLTPRVTAVDAPGHKGSA